MPTPRLKSTKPKAEAEHEQEQEAPKGKGKSFASAYKETEASTGGKRVKDGRYQALLIGAKHREKDGNETASFECVIVNEDSEAEGHLFWLYYLVWKDGEPGPGIGFLKADLTKLGVDELDVKDIPDLVSQMEEIAAEEIWFEVNMKTKAGSEYQNAFVQKAFEDQSDKPERPSH